MNLTNAQLLLITQFSFSVVARFVAYLCRHLIHWFATDNGEVCAGPQARGSDAEEVAPQNDAHF